MEPGGEPADLGDGHPLVKAGARARSPRGADLQAMPDRVEAQGLDPPLVGHDQPQQL